MRSDGAGDRYLGVGELEGVVQEMRDAQHADHAQDQRGVPAHGDQPRLEHQAAEDRVHHDHQDHQVGHVEDELEGVIQDRGHDHAVVEVVPQPLDHQLAGAHADDAEAPENERVVVARRFAGHRALAKEVDQHVPDPRAILAELTVKGPPLEHEADKPLHGPDEDGKGDENEDSE